MINVSINDHTTNYSNNRGAGAVRGVGDSDNRIYPQAIEFHKGEPCPYANVLCAEGFCFRCALRGDK